MYTVDKKQEEIDYLNLELQQQRGMLWLLGEIMKVAVDISSFKELMCVLTDMLMGVMGVTTCYLWIKIEDTDIDNYTVFYRSIEMGNEFKEKMHSSLPYCLSNLEESVAFSKEKIVNSIMKGISVPCSRLAVPMFDFGNNVPIGVLVVEHEEEHFFSNNTIAFFNTLSIYIASKAIYSNRMTQISEQSIKDPLTGAYNRRYLNTAIEMMKNEYDCVTVAIIDTDNFKTINDELGHVEGDVVLKGIAHLAQGLVKECKGQVVRYGGDEFVILLPLAKEEALQVLESFRIGVSYLKVAYSLDTNVSVTLGVCAYPEMLNDCGEALIHAADNALLRGKVKGKNRIVLVEKEDMA